LLKYVKEELATPITSLINQSIETSVFPDFLKVAKISPIYKKGEDNLFGNYRPVSVLPSISKVFERVLYNQIYEYFTNQNLLFNSQYGFRKCHSTEFTVLELSDRIIKDMDKGELPINIYLDLSKAFDTLDHEVLIEKLKYYGIKSKSLDILKSYLSNRMQYVCYDNVKSDMLKITCGVPQGSILGPLLFIIYMNDIKCASNIFNFIMYADDTAVYTVLNTSEDRYEEQLNSELELISNWLKVNRLSLNVTKTKAMLFHSTQRLVTYPSLVIDNHLVEFVKEFNYLGIIIDENLKWKVHVELIAKKVSKTIGILNRVKNYIPT
jgi:hypothetical protein